jgi:flagellar biosynthesis/type III secretory pathway protein FliH
VPKTHWHNGCFAELTSYLHADCRFHISECRGKGPLRSAISLNMPLRDVRLNDGTESLVSESKVGHLLEEQYRKGFEAGQKTLSEQLVEQRKQLLELQNGLFRSMERALPGIAAECEKSLVLLALESARRVVHDTPVNAALVERTVLTALSELKDTAEYEVLLHPEDLSMLQQAQSGILPPPDHKRIHFTPDPRIERADCVVNTRHGSIAATREHMFEKMEAAVLA